MNYPETPSEFACVLHSLADQGAFFIGNTETGVESVIPLTDIHEAIDEVVRALEAVYVGEAVLTPTQRLVGRLFMLAVDQTVTLSQDDGPLVTIQEA